MDSRPNFRVTGALLRGSSRASGPGAAFFQNESFTRFFPKNRGFQRQGLWSLIAMSEILYPVKLRSGLRADALRRLAYARRCGGSFSGELPQSGKRGLFTSEKAPLASIKYGTGSQAVVLYRLARTIRAGFGWLPQQRCVSAANRRTLSKPNFPSRSPTPAP